MLGLNNFSNLLLTSISEIDTKKYFFILSISIIVVILWKRFSKMLNDLLTSLNNIFYKILL